MTTDKPSTYQSNSNIALIGGDMTKEASQKVFLGTGYNPRDV